MTPQIIEQRGYTVPVYVAVCTNRSRPSLQNNHSKGHQWWAREVHHLEAAGQHYSTGKRTLCGRNSTDWLTISKQTSDLTSDGLCKRCRSLAQEAAGSPSVESSDDVLRDWCSG